MVAVPVSAFEMYKQLKAVKKKNKKKNKKDKIKVTPMVSVELLKASEEKKAKATAGKSSAKSTDVNVLKSEEPLFKIVEAPVPSSKMEKSNGLSDKPTSKKETKKMRKAKGDKALIGDSSEQSVEKSSKMKEELLSAKSAKTMTNPKLSKEVINVKSPKGKVGNESVVREPVSLSDVESSVETAEKFFSWMMDPISKDDFLSLYWEKRPVHISREGNRDYYSGLLSTGAIDAMLRKNNILYGKNIDITSYVDGNRETLNSAGRAHAAVVWDYYGNGCSIRLLNPQTYHTQLRELNTRLQEVFGSFVGANAYLTPPNSQGFAPHYDDIEAFVLQIEGSKTWRVYAPRDASEKLPRTSSHNFTQEEIGEPILEVLVKSGDLLYFPRGFIHQASTVPNEHSLHVTVSTYQRNSWADLLEKLVPAALTNAIEEDEEFRKGMPLDVMNHIGVVHSESESSDREAIMKKLKKLFSKLFDYAPVDGAADQLAKDYIHEALPPLLSSDEKKCSVLENSQRMVADGKLLGDVVLTPDTRIRLTRSNVLRLVSEEEPDTMKIYHSMENSLEYHGEEIQCIETPVNFAPAVEELIHSYPEFTAIRDLPLDDDSEKVQIASELWERGLVLVENSLPHVQIDV